jgi:putative transposase
MVRKLREGERLLNEGKGLTEVVRHLGIAENTWNRWRSQYGGMKADEPSGSASSRPRTPG